MRFRAGVLAPRTFVRETTAWLFVVKVRGRFFTAACASENDVAGHKYNNDQFDLAQPRARRITATTQKVEAFGFSV